MSLTKFSVSHLIKIPDFLNIITYLFFSFSNKNQFIKLVGVWDDEISKFRNDLMKTVQSMFSINQNTGKIVLAKKLVEAAMKCHLRPTKSKAKIKQCIGCKATDQFKEYECRLFNNKKRTKEVERSLLGGGKASIQEFVLKILHGMCVQKKFNQSASNDGKVHLAILDIMKKEFKVRQQQLHLFMVFIVCIFFFLNQSCKYSRS